MKANCCTLACTVIYKIFCGTEGKGTKIGGWNGPLFTGPILFPPPCQGLSMGTHQLVDQGNRLVPADTGQWTEGPHGLIGLSIGTCMWIGL